MNAKTDALVQKALGDYLDLDWPLFPVGPDKAPLTRRGLKDATCDREKVMRWWKREPAALIGVRTGQSTGFFALDIDVDAEKGLDGTAWLASQEAKWGPLPRGPRSRTPRGGMHLLFKYPSDRSVRNSAGKIAPGVDVRGDGGYIVVPPSRTARGEYVWEVRPDESVPPHAPEWLLNLVCDDPLPPPVSGALTVVDQPLSDADQSAVAAEIAKRIDLVENAKEGTRNHTLNAAAFICGKLIGAKAASEEELEARLLVAAENVGLTRLEAIRTIRSGFRAGKRRPWRPLAAEPMLAEINRDHFFALDGRAAFVFREDVDPRSGHRYLAHITPNAFKEQFGNQFVLVHTKDGLRPAPLGQTWLKSGYRRQYQKVVFAPGKDLPQNVYNQWQGFAAEPIEGDCSKFLAFVKEVICADDASSFDYLIRWCARAVQDPSSPGHTAIVMRGGKGTGKTYFASHFGELFGDHFVQMSSAHHLVGHFNAHLETAIVVLADEAFWAGDKQGEGTLKTLITSDTIRVERKGIDSKRAPNHVHLIMASNSDWVVPASADERRYLVLDVSAARKQNHAYFEELERDWQSGGREAFMHFLLHLDLSSFNVRKVPQSQALLDQKLLSMPVVDRWYLSMLREGRNRLLLPENVGRKGDAWVDWMSTQALFDACRTFADEERVRLQLAREAFGMRLQHLLPPPDTKDGTRRVQRQDQGRRTWGYSFPSLETCRSHFEEVIGFRLSWETEGLGPTSDLDKSAMR